MRRGIPGLALAGILVALTSCGGGKTTRAPSRDRVPGRFLVGIDASTSPHGVAPGRGVAVFEPGGRDRPVAVAEAPTVDGLSGTWLDASHIVASEGEAIRVLAIEAGKMRVVATYRAWKRAYGSAIVWPEGRLVAVIEARESACAEGTCYEPGRLAIIDLANGGRRVVAAAGRFVGWTPDGQLAFICRSAAICGVDPDGGRRVPILPELSERSRRALAAASAVSWSPDNRWLAAVIGQRTRASTDLLVTDMRNGRSRRFHLKLRITDLAWNPSSRLLAVSAGGFPDPHELLIVTPPGRLRRRLKAARHLDWVTWQSSTGRLVLDDEARNRWLTLSVAAGKARALPRLGARPLWCCSPAPVPVP